MKPLWVFGYGSLMWEPGFDYAERVLAQLPGWHRSFCMHSLHYRGTPERPGLVLALDASDGAVCDGVAYRVDETEAETTLAYLRERELISYAYLETEQRLQLADGRAVDAVTFVINRDHIQYCGVLPLDEQAAIIAEASGGRGPNADYLWNTVQHLNDLGIADPDLDRLAEHVKALRKAS